VPAQKWTRKLLALEATSRSGWAVRCWWPQACSRGNSFAAELAPLMRRYFTSATQNNDQDIYDKGYVGSDDVIEYDRILESLLKYKMVGRRRLSQELSLSDFSACLFFLLR
jgi:hypothetical protein